MIFSDSPIQIAFERMMTQVKSFPPRGSGVVVLRHFEYTAEMCGCRLCLYYDRKRKCTVSQCPCIEERIVAGAASRAEVMVETMKDIHNAAFRRRLNQFIRESEKLYMNFRNEKHRLAFVEAIRKLDKKNFALMSAIYLLTADHKLWMQIRHFVERNEVKFECFKPKDSTENGYTLLCCTAAGRCGVFFEGILALWDYAAAALIVKEAGGICVTMDGDALDYRTIKTSMIAGPERNVRYLLELFAQ